MLPLKSIFIFASKAQLLAYLTSQSAISPISSCETKFLKYGANFEDNFGANDILLSYLSMIINYLPCFFSLKWSGSAATQVIIIHGYLGCSNPAFSCSVSHSSITPNADTSVIPSLSAERPYFFSFLFPLTQNVKSVFSKCTAFSFFTLQ